ncbi:unnamed protein product [Clonostachys rhizophaga]|uniref:Uncharacterized protein n=1 Tax=Clonostachys rhizophaga TaxID=160324 RepID=A0A9N9VIK6_9HYPO|nr:unnamed protein product [Clonostachys rhizophaga]
MCSTATMAEVLSRAANETGVGNSAQLNAPTIWSGSRGKTVEGFNMTAELYFEGKRHWGPAKCHQNAVRITTALREADPRLELRLDNASKSNEGVTRTLSLKKSNKLLLNEHPIHDNMVPMVDIIKTIWTISPPTN